MAKVIYRGVEYDSKEYNAKVLAEAAKRNRHELNVSWIKSCQIIATKHNIEGVLDTPFFIQYNI